MSEGKSFDWKGATSNSRKSCRTPAGRRYTAEIFV